ncbi:hypothetical protein BHU72_01650 [Desulfuribacillus stibiiarsenatis]|uniref:DUF2157 domain-containing protein n=1 Tax=Desulfuribacillus stibiiarsenatis TaxID=1390249 RepID=A0A1E5LA39_9FIRM|nr:hypothetical protein [Desulfuribacillus stibiiarsenatis]OEH86986.1 hypothetical protein BHU72_01650 [Desulfuribacillus stibiiarsenatis]
MDNRTRKKIFEEELGALKQKEYITHDEYSIIANAYEIYSADRQLAVQKLQGIQTPSEKIIKPVYQPKPKKVLSAQDIRDRNITWILIVGVIMVLLSGVIIATSAWDNLNNMTKTIGISLVAVLFFAISWLTENKLKIEKTAFAFWILGSLFLPVTVLSIGYFQLFGTYLSITGEGKYLLGVFAVILCFPVYVYSAHRYQNKLFTWISLTTLSLGIGFAIASFYPPVDVFYLGMIVYNCLLLAGYMYLKKNQRFKLFFEELPLFTQVNLIVSTLLMLSFYKSPVFYGFNILLTAVLYMLMVYSQGKKEYVYVFGGLLVYGIYQVVENSILQSFNFLIFALAGFIFIGLEKYLKNDDSLKKIYQILSGVVSLIAFLYISAEAMMIGMGSSSVILLISYLLIALNYIYLAYKTERIIFSYLAPVFLMVAGFQSYQLMKNFYSFFGVPIHMFTLAVAMFLGLYVFNKHKYLIPIRFSSLLVSITVMFMTMLLAFVDSQFSLLTVMLLIFGIVCWVVHKKSDHPDLQFIGKWSMPVAWFLGILSYYSVVYPDFHESHYSIWLILATVILLGVHEIFRRKSQTELAESFFYVGHGALVYTVGNLILALSMGINQPILFIACLFVYIYSMYRTTMESMVKYSLYGAFTMFTITLLAFIEYWNLSSIHYTQVLLFASAGIFLLWYQVSDSWRKRIMFYLIPFSLITVLFTMIETTYFDVENVITSVLAIILSLWIIKACNRPLINILPLAAFIYIMDITVNDAMFQSYEKAFILLGTIFIVKIVGEKLQKHLYNTSTKKDYEIIDSIDWYTLTAFVLTIQMMFIYQANLFLAVIPYLLIPYLLFSQIKRVDGAVTKIVQTITVVSILLPYYYLLYRLDVPRIIETELIVLPWILLVIVLSTRLWSSQQALMKKLEYGVLVAAAIFLLNDTLIQNNPLEGIILGILCLISIIGGFYKRKKSFFFIGIGTLGVNVLINTREYWGNLPWWAYLLAAGLILIVVASLNEIEKNNGGKKPKINKEVIIEKFKSWQ